MSRTPVPVTLLTRLTLALPAILAIGTGEAGNAQATPARTAPTSAATAATPADAANETLLLQQPTIGGNRIAFVYAGDLWVVSREGGLAQRLTGNSGIESSPQLSPDGSWIAFTGQYDGNADVYVIPSTGGTPRRLTWHPGRDTVLDWHPDGKRVLFRSSRLSGQRVTRAFLVNVDGGTPVALPPHRVARAAFSPDGSQLAMTPVPAAFRSWKRYRGGRTTPLWIYDPKTHAVEVVPHENASDTFPAWVGDKLYFGSDRDGVMNLWSYTPQSQTLEQVTHYRDFHIRNIDSDRKSLVFEQAGALHRLDQGAIQRLRIRVQSDGLAAVARWQPVGNAVRAAALAPNGKRVAIEARGEILTLPREHGAPRHVTNSPGAHDRSPAWSPDGKRLAWFSDQSGEYELLVTDARGRSEPQRFDLTGSAPVEAAAGARKSREVGGFYYRPDWSPDGERILFQDKTNRLAFLALDSGEVTAISHQQGSLGVLQIEASWSPDGRFVAYSERNPHTAYDDIVLYEVATGRRATLTDGFADAGEPSFSPSGKYLYFAASVDSGPSRFGLDLSSNAARRTTSNLYVAVLAKETAHPFGPREDESFADQADSVKQAKPKSDDDAEKPDADRTGSSTDARATKADAADTAKKPKSDSAKKLPEVVVDFDDLDQRVLAMPLPRGRYRNLVGERNGLLYLHTRDGDDGPVSRLMFFDLAKRKAESLATGIQGFGASADGKSLLLSSGRGELQIANRKAKDRKTLATKRIKVRVDPAEEWPQMLREVWRLQRDFFYDPGMHGVDWDEMWRRWEPYLAHVRHRQDLNLVIAELIGELSCGHQYVSGGELPDAPDGVSIGLLGADFVADGDRYRIAKIYRGQNWNPNLRAPLTAPGVDVTEGTQLIAVDGRDVTTTDNLHAAFENTANRRVELEIVDPRSGEARTVVVQPIPSEAALRRQSWVEERRRRVDERSGGKLAYIYMPNTAGAGLAAFERDFYSQLDKKGLILDERYNGGGKVADHVIDVLSREVMCYWLNREQWPAQTPFGTFDGPKVMLINEMAGSGGDAMPWLFRRAGLGPLVGTRTWGGLVGISGYPPLVDGGRVTAASFGVMDTNGNWAVENVGVAPDHEVIEWPEAVVAGKDPQLDRAIELCLEAVGTHRRRAKPRYTPPTRR